MRPLYQLTFRAFLLEEIHFQYLPRSGARNLNRSKIPYWFNLLLDSSLGLRREDGEEAHDSCSDGLDRNRSQNQTSKAVDDVDARFAKEFF